MAEAAMALAAVAATVGVYLAAERLYRRSGWFVLNPVLVSVAVLIAALLALHVDYADYQRGGRVLAWLLGPAVVALGVPLAEHWEEIVRHGRAIFPSILAGSLTGIVAAAGTARLLGATPEVVRSLAPRSVTTPIAMGISAKVGGIPSLTAALVIATGVLGAVAGPALLRALGVRSRTAVGLALGSAAHGIGTARAVEEGEVEGATAGLAIGLMGVATAVLVPLLLRLLF
jgi:predicted murein hydrolase (TIGR00659 family)